MDKNRTAIITGGGSGLGKALVETFLEKGWRVATFGRRQSRIDDLLREHHEQPLIAQSCDIRLENQVAGFLERVQRKWDGVDLLILNAGTLGPVPMPHVLDTGLMELRTTFETNFFANINLIRKAKELLRVPSQVIHITSDAAATPYPGWGAYSSSKAAMDRIISILNEESADSGVYAFSFDPGDMNTEMHALALPEDRPEILKAPDESALELYELAVKRLGVT